MLKLQAVFEQDSGQAFDLAVRRRSEPRWLADDAHEVENAHGLANREADGEVGHR